MAHVEHFKLNDIKRITNEFEREPECNNLDNRIDVSKTKFNYELQPRKFHKELNMKLEMRLNHVNHSTRKDLNVMSSWIITCPQELLNNPDDVKKFFEVSYKFCQDRYGADNVLNGYVHMDETTPHMHTPIVPVKDDRVSAKALFTRKELSSFHSDLDKLCEKEFGIKHLVKNGRTKGDYTVAELKERMQNEEALKAKEKALEARESDLAIREGNLSLKEQELLKSNAMAIKRQQELDEREEDLAMFSKTLNETEDILFNVPSPDKALTIYAKSVKFKDGSTVYDRFEAKQQQDKRNSRNRRSSVFDDITKADKQGDNQFS